MEKLVTKFWSAASIALAALMIANAANATLLLATDTTGNVTGINGLVVDGTTYNVTFDDTTLNTSSPFAYGSQVGVDAASSLSAALNSLAPSNVLGYTTATQDSNGTALYNQLFLWVDQDPTNTSFSGDAAYSQYSSLWGAGLANTLQSPGYHCYTSTSSGECTYDALLASALFVTAPTSSNVPEPASLSLLGIGLVGLGVSRKRKQKPPVE